MLAAAWQATSAVFIVGFFVYVLLATWTLILFHLRREIEENYLVRHTGDDAGARVTVTRVLNSRRVVGWPFFLTTGLVAVLVFGGAALVFVSVPRVGVGFFLGGVRRQTSVAGFSDEVKLGMHGVLSLDNQTVVLRAQVPRIAAVRNDEARESEIASLYWREPSTTPMKTASGSARGRAHPYSPLALPSIQQRHTDLRSGQPPSTRPAAGTHGSRQRSRRTGHRGGRSGPRGGFCPRPADRGGNAAPATRCLHLRRRRSPLVGRAGPAHVPSQSFRLCRSPLRHARIRRSPLPRLLTTLLPGVLARG